MCIVMPRKVRLGIRFIGSAEVSLSEGVDHGGTVPWWAVPSRSHLHSNDNDRKRNGMSTACNEYSCLTISIPVATHLPPVKK